MSKNIRKSRSNIDRLRCVVFGFLTLITGVTVPIWALADGGREVQVAGRTLSFIENGPTGKVVFAVVFDPSKPASVTEKDEIMAALGSGLSAGAMTITGKAVPVSEVSSVAGVGAYYLTRGVNYAAIGAAAKSKKTLSISADMACVKSGACVMGIAISPKVEIVVNSASATATGIAFKAAFKMMIKEI